MRSSVVADHPAREGGEDWREGDRSRPLHGVPDGRGGGPARAVPPYFCDDRRTPTKAGGAMLRLKTEVEIVEPDGSGAPAPYRVSGERRCRTGLAGHLRRSTQEPG